MRTMYVYRISPRHAATVDTMFIAAGEAGPLQAPTYVITRVFVPEPHRGQGYGRAVMHEVIADADREGVRLMLEINPYGPLDFKALEAWYARLGFINAGGFNLYVRDPAGGSPDA